MTVRPVFRQLKGIPPALFCRHLLLDREPAVGVNLHDDGIRPLILRVVPMFPCLCPLDYHRIVRLVRLIAVHKFQLLSRLPFLLQLVASLQLSPLLGDGHRQCIQRPVIAPTFLASVQLTNPIAIHTRLLKRDPAQLRFTASAARHNLGASFASLRHGLSFLSLEQERKRRLR